MSVLVFGDLHFSDVYEGQHKDYLTNCFSCMGKIVSLVEERKPDTVVFLGDIVGWNETNIKSREVLSKFVECFQRIFEVAKNGIYAVRGNHDLSGYPDYDFLIKLGLLKYTDHFDYGFDSQGKPDVRFHLVNYGDEGRELDILEGSSNVVLGHNNFVIEGVTTWYHEHHGINLNLHKPFEKVDLVISGHIHEPSPYLVEVAVPGGNSCGLFYCGCPTRPVKSKVGWDSCWAVDFTYQEGTTEFDAIPIELSPWDELFEEDDITEVSDDELAESIRREQLADVLQDIITYRMTGGDLMAQIDTIPNASEEARGVAKDYLRIAQGGK